MKVATFNANSIRVRAGIVLDWLAENEPDALLIQETKCEDGQFPIDDFEEAGWNVVFDGQKSYNGVAIVSRHGITDVQKGFGDPAWPDDKRILAATVLGQRLVNTYVPNGTKVGSDKWTYKLAWFDRFRDFLGAQIKRHGEVIWGGDINVAPKPLDVFDSPRMLGGVCHHPDEFAKLASIVDLGLTEAFRHLHPTEEGAFTYWEFVVREAFERNRGWRIDHFYLTPGLVGSLQSCTIDRAPRALERPSDHTFVVMELA